MYRRVTPANFYDKKINQLGHQRAFFLMILFFGELTKKKKKIAQ